MSKRILTLSEVQAILGYNPETGVLTWKSRPKGRGHNRATGPADYLCPQGYVKVNIKGRIYRGHRIAWLLHYGEWPKATIDHINRKRDDNRIVNLREAKQGENMQNTKVYASNKSGHKGVFWHKEVAKWWAYIDVGCKRVSLGRFEAKEDAIAARTAAVAKYHAYATTPCC